MKTIILFTFLCLLSLGSKAQIVINTYNTGSCDVSIKVVAIDLVTCTPIASATAPFIAVAGAPPAFYPVTLSPAPTVNFIVAAYVTYASCPGIPVLVGHSGGPCGIMSIVSIPSGCSCGPDVVVFPAAILPPTYPPGKTFDLIVHP
jgi:hypothetical protein